MFWASHWDNFPVLNGDGERADGEGSRSEIRGQWRRGGRGTGLVCKIHFKNVI